MAAHLARREFRDRMAALGFLTVNVVALARHLGVSREALYRYLRGDAVLPDAAARLRDFFEEREHPTKKAKQRRAGERARSAA